MASAGTVSPRHLEHEAIRIDDRSLVVGPASADAGSQERLALTQSIAIQVLGGETEAGDDLGLLPARRDALLRVEHLEVARASVPAVEALDPDKLVEQFPRNEAQGRQRRHAVVHVALRAKTPERPQPADERGVPARLDVQGAEPIAHRANGLQHAAGPVDRRMAG